MVLAHAGSVTNQSGGTIGSAATGSSGIAINGARGNARKISA
jgi:hypothetical protein